MLFDGPNRVVEVRAIRVPGVPGSGIVSGYFDNPDAFVNAAMRLDARHAAGVYATLNPVKPELLARAHDRLVERPPHATSDAEIVRRARLLIDCDPKRATGISSSEDELQAALQTAREVADFLTSLGFPEAARGLSGNGGHLIYAIDLPAADDGLIQRFLQALASRFNTDLVQVDESVHNAARMTKVYGTVARKGDALPDRPHRRSSIQLPEMGLRLVPIELLQRVADLAPRIDAEHAGTRAIDVDKLLERAGVEVARRAAWNGGRRWILATCPFSPEHQDRSAYVVQLASGALAAGCHHNTCQGKGWHELRDILDPGCRDRRGETSGGSGSRAPGPSETLWPEPTPLPDDLRPVAVFDLALLPSSIGPWVVDIAERMQCPPEFPGVAAMVGLAGVVGRRIGIRPKRYDDWTVVPNLWGAVIGRPGLLKSPAIQEGLNPLKRLELERKEQYAQDLERYQAQAIVADALKREAKEAVREELEKGGTAEALKIAASICESKPERPVRRRYLVNDSTVEKLGEILNENPNGVVCFRDELIGLLQALDKEGQEGARAFYLQAWDGTGRYTYDRIGRGTIDIDAAIVSAFGGIQPGPIRTYLQHAVGQTNQDDGLMQRFQLTVWPDAPRTWVNVDRWPDTEAKRTAYAVYRALDEMDPQAREASVDEREPDGIPYLRFSAAAQDLFDAWRARLEIRLRSVDEHPAIESHLAKYRSLVPSLSLLIHLADGGYGAVEKDALMKAIAWAAYLETHARRIYGVAVNPDLFAAKALARKISRRELADRFALRDVYRNGWTHLSNRDLATRAVEVLIDHEWLRAVQVKDTGGAPKTVHLINPRVWEMRETPTDTTDKSQPSASSVGSDSRQEGGLGNECGADDGEEGAI